MATRGRIARKGGSRQHRYSWHVGRVHAVLTNARPVGRSTGSFSLPASCGPQPCVFHTYSTFCLLSPYLLNGEQHTGARVSWPLCISLLAASALMSFCFCHWCEAVVLVLSVCCPSVTWCLVLVLVLVLSYPAHGVLRSQNCPY